MTDRPADLFGQRLRDARQRLGLSQKQMGARAGTSGPAISLYETAARTPPLDVALKLAKIAGISLDAVIWSDDGNPNGREMGSVLDTDGRPLAIGAARSAVTIGGHHFDSYAIEDVARLIVAACWQAAASARTDAERAEMRAAAEEIRLADCGAATHDHHCRETTDA